MATYFWRDDAACIGQDPNLFAADMPPGSAARVVKDAHERTVLRALAVCGRCPVKAQCLQDAYDTGDKWTIRGGMTGDERIYARRRELEAVS